MVADAYVTLFYDKNMGESQRVLHPTLNWGWLVGDRFERTQL